MLNTSGTNLEPQNVSDDPLQDFQDDFSCDAPTEQV